MLISEEINSIRMPVHGLIKSNIESTKEQILYVYNNLSRLVELYRSTKNNEVLSREIRKDIDIMLRRSHSIVNRCNNAHYIQVDTENDNTIFEHMIPNNVIRELLIANQISINQACNMPTCLLSTNNDQLLKDNGWNSKTPNIFNFWLRYEYCFNVTGHFETWDGATINSKMTLKDHFMSLKINA